MIPAGPDHTSRHFRRVILTLSLAHNGEQDHAIEHTVNFADVFGSDVACLCIRDSDLLDYATLPFAREFLFHGLKTRPLDSDELRRDMDRRATTIQQSLEKLSKARHRQHSFTVVDGRMDDKAVETVEEDDLLVITPSLHALQSFDTIYDKISRIIAQRHCHILLLLEAKHVSNGSITLIVHNALPSDRTIDLVFHIARQRHASVDVFVTDYPALSDSLRSICTDKLATLDAPKPVLTIQSLNQRLLHPWRRSPCSLMVVDHDDAPPPGLLLDKYLTVFQAPLLLLRR